jgi:hypothetical protein
MGNLVQLSRAGVRRAVVVEGAHLLVLSRFAPLYDLATAAWAAGVSLEDFAGGQSAAFSVAYDDIYEAASEWRLLVPFDHPGEPARGRKPTTGLEGRVGRPKTGTVGAHGEAAARKAIENLQIGILLDCNVSVRP